MLVSSSIDCSANSSLSFIPFWDNSSAKVISIPSTDIKSPESPSSVETSIAIVIRTSLALFIKRLLMSSSKPSIFESASIEDEDIDSKESKPLDIKV